MPDALLIRPTVMVVFDGARDEMAIVTPVRPAPGVSARAAYESAMARLDAVVDALEQPLDHAAGMAVDPLVQAGEARSNTTEAEYKAMVGRAKDYIAAGDAFQIVLSQRFTQPLRPAGLRPLSGAAAGQSVALSVFPRFRRLPDRLLEPRDPGARARRQGRHPPDRRHTAAAAKSPTEDEALAAELLADPKERAEHLMLLDLGRNDVGRVAEDRHGQGDRQLLHRALQPRDAHRLQRRGRTATTASTRSTALAAGFPAGTVSGAPKVRAMQIIDELEKDKRGIYAGCIGYFGAGGEMDTCIVLRASVVKDGLMHVQAGAGIVYDCSPPPSRTNA